MTSIISYDPTKETPRPRTGARGFNTAKNGSVFFDPNIATPVSDELLSELEQDFTFKSLKECGAIKVEVAKEQQIEVETPRFVPPLEPPADPPVLSTADLKKPK